MTGVTLAGGGDVVDGFARGLGAVMATGASTGDIGMIEGTNGPGIGIMAIATVLAGGNMISRLAGG